MFLMLACVNRPAGVMWSKVREIKKQQQQHLCCKPESQPVITDLCFFRLIDLGRKCSCECQTCPFYTAEHTSINLSSCCTTADRGCGSVCSVALVVCLKICHHRPNHKDLLYVQRRKLSEDSVWTDGQELNIDFAAERMFVRSPVQ